MDQKSGQENMAVEERWLLWGGGRKWRFHCSLTPLNDAKSTCGYSYTSSEEVTSSYTPSGDVTGRYTPLEDVTRSYTSLEDVRSSNCCTSSRR